MDETSFAKAPETESPAQEKPKKRKIAPRVQFVVETADQDYTVVLHAGNPISTCAITCGAVLEEIPVPSPATELVGYGLGVRKHGDRYHREFGFRMALKAALAWVPKEERAAFWASYLEIFPIEARDTLPEEQSQACGAIWGGKGWKKVAATQVTNYNLIITMKDHVPHPAREMADDFKALQALGAQA